MITPEQIKAARALLKVDRSALAKMSGVSVTTISNVEAFKVPLTERTANKIFKYCTKEGIEFLDDKGVKMSRTGHCYFYGKLGLRELLEIVHSDVRMRADNNEKTTIRVGNVNESLFVKYAREYSMDHVHRMNTLYRGGMLDVKVIIREGDDNPMAFEYAEYRSIEKEFFSETSYYIWGNNMAFFEAWDPLHILLVRSNIIAESQKKIFDCIWYKHAKECKKKESFFFTV